MPTIRSTLLFTVWLLLYFEVVCSEMENGGKKQEQQWNDSNRKILRKEASGKAMKPHIRISSYKEPTPQIERHIFQMPEQLWTFLPGRWQPLLAFLVELSQINNQENNHHHTSAAGGYETEWQEQGRIHHDIPDPPDNNLYLFDKNAFQTPLDTPFFQGQKIDVYYIDGTPKRVVALHIYNQFDAPSLWFAVAGFDKTAGTLPHTSTSSILGQWIVGIGLLITLYGILRVFLYWRQRSVDTIFG